MKTLHTRRLRILCSLFLVFSFLGIQSTNAQIWKRKKKEEKKEAPKPKPKPKKKEKTIKDLTKSSKKIEGLFTIYQDTVTGVVKLLIKENQLNKEISASIFNRDNRVNKIIVSIVK